MDPEFRKEAFVLSQQWVMLGSLTGFFSVTFGAFGAHFMKDRLSEKGFLIYQTAVQYQFFHALALILLGIWGSIHSHHSTQWVGYLFVLGTCIFSGSLYILAITEIRFFGALAPIGGVSFLLAWLGFAWLAWKN